MEKTRSGPGRWAAKATATPIIEVNSGWANGDRMPRSTTVTARPTPPSSELSAAR
jgi:hypothetical protein